MKGKEESMDDYQVALMAASQGLGRLASAAELQERARIALAALQALRRASGGYAADPNTGTPYPGHGRYADSWGNG